MKNTINHKKNQLPDSGQQLDLNHYLWQQARLEGIVDLHSLTEAARELDAVATAQNPEANHYYYSTFINLIYKELFNVPKGKTRGLRNRLSTAQLKKLQTVEQHTAQWIREMLAARHDYHQVYYRVQKKVRTLVKQLGKEDLSEQGFRKTTGIGYKQGF